MTEQRHRVVIIGGGFGGMNVAKGLMRQPVDVTLIDKRNFHLFQPLLYQVATGGLSPGDIAHPLRAVFSNAENITTLKAEAVDIDPVQQKVMLRDGDVDYDTLVVATGATHSYFGHDEWEKKAPGLKTMEDALTIRHRILLAFEAAERESNPEKRQAWMTFVVVGGGPTGVELAGALAELAKNTLENDFRRIDPADTRIILVEAVDRVLPPYPENLSAKAQKSLEKLGVQVKTNLMVTDIQDDLIKVKNTENDQVQEIKTQTVLWGAGTQASKLGHILHKKAGAELNRAGKVKVEPNLSVAAAPNIFVIGDLAFATDDEGQPLPGLASVAMQQGKYIAKLIKQRLIGQATDDFSYVDKGMMSIIGRNSAVAQAMGFEFSGFIAWLVWVFVHIYYLIGFDNKVAVILQWAWNYITYNRGARLITNEKSYNLIHKSPDKQPFASS